ncbi:MAG: hypothetical protein WC451_03050 [Patescibacteria group bacterium]|jgi:hypothetical protein
MDDNLLADNDPDEFSDEYFEELEEKLLKDDDPDKKFAPDSGRSVFELEKLKRKRTEEKREE